VRPQAAVRALAAIADGESCVVGSARSCCSRCKKHRGLRPFPHHKAKASTCLDPAALWCWLRGEDRGEIVLRAREAEKILAPAFETSGVIDAFRYAAGSI